MRLYIPSIFLTVFWIIGCNCQLDRWKGSWIMSWLNSRLGLGRQSPTLPPSVPTFPPMTLASETTIPDTGIHRPLVICTWNIFRFGPAKFSLPDPLISAGKNVTRLQIILDQLADCDIAAIQEYMDIGGTVVERLRSELSNKTGKTYAYTISPRVGKTSFEQYIFLYRADVVEPVRSVLFPDKEKELFHREPFFTKFRVLDRRERNLTEFVLGTIHTAPDEAVFEVNNLVDAFDWAVQNFSSPDVMILGDYNADCSYIKASDWWRISLWTQKRFKWITDSEMDTTSMTTHCAYDRAVYLGNAFHDSYINGTVQAPNFTRKFGLTAAQAKLVSDHLLVRMEFR